MHDLLLSDIVCGQGTLIKSRRRAHSPQMSAGACAFAHVCTSAPGGTLMCA
jgi:hypothetical protein